MKDTSHHDELVANVTFASGYPHYVTKVEKKHRSVEELHQVIHWLTGFTDKQIAKHIADEVTFSQFFKKANWR